VSVRRWFSWLDAVAKLMGDHFVEDSIWYHCLELFLIENGGHQTFEVNEGSCD
jgi:hypothetical protein